MSLIKNILNIILFATLFSIVTQRVVSPEINIQPDSPRYISMGLNLAEYGTLTGNNFNSEFSPGPGLGQGGTFTAFEIALAAKLDNTTKASLACLAQTSDHDACDVRIPALKAIYIFELFIFHIAVRIVAYLIFTNQIKAWLAVGISLGFQETKIFADSILTEPSYMMASGVFLVLWVYAWQHRQSLKPWFLCGVALGVTALIKPAWNALLPALIVLIPLLYLWFRETMVSSTRAVLTLVAGVILVAAPLFIRNVIQLDLWGISNPDYLVVQLAHRFAFNAMSWGEWAMGWVYYLPLSGAGRLFGYEVLEPLGWGESSYYVYGRDVLHRQATMQGSAREATQYLIENHFLNTPVKALAVTMLLFWRGIFVGHVVGMLAVPLIGIFLYVVRGETRRLFLILSIPPIIMAGAHALISVSIYRYNIPLIIPYALAMAHLAYVLCQWSTLQIPQNFRTRMKRIYSKNEFK